MNDKCGIFYIKKTFSFKVIFDDKSKLLVFVSCCLFFYPLLGVVIRSWLSVFAVLIIVSGILYLIEIKRNNEKLNLFHQEIVLCLSVSMLFVSYLVSGFVNGWNSNQLVFFAGEFNFFLFIPLYIIIRSISNSVELIVKGTILAGILISPLFIYEIIILKNDHISGPYSHLFIGPIAVLIAFTSISSYKYLCEDRCWKFLIVLSTLISLTSALYSNSGTAYILILAFSIFTPFIIFKGVKKRIIIAALMMFMLIITYSLLPVVNSRIDRIFHSVELYFFNAEKKNLQGKLGSAGIRIELWKSGINVFSDNVFFGVGRNNFILYADQELISNNLVNHYVHPHNIYIETLVSKGLFGFMMLALIIFSLSRNYIQAKNKSIKFSDTSLIHLVFILLSGIGTEAPLLKNNYISIFLLYSAVFYSHNIRELKSLARTMI